MDETPGILFSRKEDNFETSRTGDYDLLICLDEKTFSYCIRDSRNDKFIVLETLKEPVDRILQLFPWMKQSFRSVHLVVENNRSTLVPELLYDDTARENLLDFTVDRENHEKILADHLQHPEVYNVYSVPEAILQRIEEDFPGSAISHIASVMIETIWLNFKNRISSKKLFINLREESFDLVVFDGTVLHYSNAFPFRSPEDIAYYVIFVMEQLDLNPEETGAILLGKVDKKSPVFELLYRYIRNLEFPARSDSVKVSPVFHDVPEHQFYLLLNPSLCGS